MTKINQRQLSYGEQQELKRVQDLYNAKMAKHSGKRPAPGSKRYNGMTTKPSKYSNVVVERSQDN